MASVVDLDMENLQLKAQIQALKLELEDKQSQMTLSGKLGNELLQSNNELNRNLEEIQELHLQEMEELRQENYSLRMKIDQEKLAKKNFANEMETTKEKLQQNMKQELARQENVHEKKVEELRAETESLHSALEKNSLVNEQLHTKILKQEEMLAEAHRYSKQIQGMGALETQLEDMKEECTLMRLKKEELKIAVDDVNAEKEQLVFDKQNLVQKIEMLKENLEETSSQGKIWFDTLQSSRQQLSELQLENSTLKAEAMNRSHKEKGNSLFGEVEDRRLELEQQNTALSAKYRSLSTTHKITKKQLIELKTHILPMLTMAGNQADSSKIKRLEAALIQSKSEIQSLYVKIEELEKEK
ncbi:Spindly-like, partial [Paramuricea clavata]